jgi:arylsulfatase A-like enzyme
MLANYNKNLNLIRTIGLGAAAVTLNQCDSSINLSQEKPNILFIMSDDHTSQAISAYGGILADVCPTPNIDRLADEGMLFNNCFVTNSICSPSRAAIFTGKYAHKNGVYKFTALDQSQPTLPKIMQEAGYHTALIGKYHLHSNPVGLDYFSILPGQGSYHNPEFIEAGDEHPSGWVQQGKRTEYQGHSSDVIADKALDYLKNKRDKDKPFMLFCHFKAPHDTWEFAERYRDFLEEVEIPEPGNLFDDYEGRSDALKTTLQYIGSEWGDHTDFIEETKHLEGVAKKKMQYQLYMKKYLRCVKGVDDNVGRILDYLDESGLAKNTIVIYTGDQGFFLGEHGLYDKRFMYEEALRMPFLVRWPGRIKRGSISEGMILNIDFAPTILEAAGVKVHPGMQGRSFMPLLKGKLPSDWRKSMYYRYYYSHFETEPHYGVRTYTHKLIYFNKIDQWELYDLVSDPNEMNNLYENPDYKQVAEDLKKELNHLQAELGDDPGNNGNNPNIGDLTARPLYTTKDVDIGKGDISILIRFCTNTGGTLFSKCNLDGVYDDEYNWQSIKALFIRESGLVFNYIPEIDEFEKDDVENEIGGNLTDNRWHTVAVVLRGKYPEIYIDGKLEFKGVHKIREDDPGHTFNIGAGIDDSGYAGYNFIGTISHVLCYNESLEEDAIKTFAEGDTPEGNTILERIR